MTNILYVRGTPKSTEQSYSLRLAEHFLSTYTAEHPNATVTELDLYEDHIPLIDEDVMNGWGKLAQQAELNHHEQRKVERLGELVDQFLASDVVVIAAPMWNFGYPPMVKAYMDAIAVAGKTFKYTEQGPVGLAGDKKVVIIEARGNTYTGASPFASAEHSASHLKAFLGLLGITDVDVLLAEGLAIDPSKAEDIFQTAAQHAATVARAF
ncbi:FMN-dependent NADH-azoreductase [Deinococcus maricopensis]|uniref:FMN dependent NADH:quinone oxidoreductase n=1 Tax=Deinococcus maricopensis (strain DSM 21211 / LMG 22137 / NRRL B-23946 / LB-34) TaxID=709986 RepID=E8U319_DEIML|nr:FMN-dependent NADH-azoreductase [Deinococcus maricopensis]ADV65757.1 FMN-dependent NADH-azoreductase [Deinococcus maricopensis DSM 21211]